MVETPSPPALQEGSTTSAKKFVLHPRVQVLKNEDILEVIFSYFEPQAFFDDISNILDVKQSTRKALLFACLTCRSFITPALNLLWRMMTSLMPIFKILPTFIKVNDIYTFSGAIEPVHMERFGMYARKVRFLWIESLPDIIAGHCIHRLSSIPNFQLFPALRMLYMPKLVYYPKNIDNFNALFLVHGDLLTTITIGSINSPNESLVASLLFSLSHKAPAVQDLNLSGRLSFEILGFIQNFKRLQSIHLTFDSASQISFLQCCSDLPDLTHLALFLNNATIEDSVSPNRERIKGFLALRDLCLVGIPGELVKILESIDGARQLKIIMIRSILSWPTNPQAISIHTQICIEESCRVAPCLNALELNMGRGKSIILAAGSLSPLIRCRQLHRFGVIGVSLPVTDDHIRELCGSDSWQNLRILCLPPAVEGQSPSMSSLHTLAVNCPNLNFLKIPIDFKLHTPSSLQNERRLPRGSHRLEHLYILKMANHRRYESDTNNTPKMDITIARFIEYYFPHLEEANLHLQSDVQGDAEWWSAVKTNIAEYRSVRAEAELELIQKLNLKDS